MARITALITSSVHWLAANGPKWASDLGLLSGSGRPQRPSRDGWTDLQLFLSDQRGLAEDIGEWAYYGVAALMVLALVKWFPYRWFSRTHTILAVAYLALVIHGVVLLDYSEWIQPVGIAMAMLMTIGSISALFILFRRVGKKYQVHGCIERLEYFPKLNVLETKVKINEGWKGHESGQFAFVTFNEKERAHPYTIASAWNSNERHLTFLTKGLGDYTDTLPEELQIGDTVTIEGPYGCFTFDAPQQRQIWIGGGIGITPFVARLQQLAQRFASLICACYCTG